MGFGLTVIQTGDEVMRLWTDTLEKLPSQREAFFQTALDLGNNRRGFHADQSPGAYTWAAGGGAS